MSEAKPRGVVGTLCGPDGYVWATATDFDGNGYGGFTSRESQELRVRRALAREMIRGACSDVVAQAVDQFIADKIVEELVRRGFRRSIIPIGYDDITP